MVAFSFAIFVVIFCHFQLSLLVTLVVIWDEFCCFVVVLSIPMMNFIARGGDYDEFDWWPFIFES